MHTHETCGHKKLTYCKECDAVHCDTCDKKFNPPVNYWAGTNNNYQIKASNPMPLVDCVSK